MLDTYVNTFIHASEDSPATEGTVPSAKASGKSMAQLEHELLADHPYEYTMGELQFAVHLAHKGIPPEETEKARKEYFSVPHACLRASPLAKRYGWGFHFDAAGRVALVAVGSPEYKRFSGDPSLQQLKGMRSSRKP